MYCEHSFGKGRDGYSDLQLDIDSHPRTKLRKNLPAGRYEIVRQADDEVLYSSPDRMEIEAHVHRLEGVKFFGFDDCNPDTCSLNLHRAEYRP